MLCMGYECWGARVLGGAGNGPVAVSMCMCPWEARAMSLLSFQPRRMITGLTPTRSCWLWVRDCLEQEGRGGDAAWAPLCVPQPLSCQEIPIPAALPLPEGLPFLPCLLPPPQAFLTV